MRRSLPRAWTRASTSSSSLARARSSLRRREHRDAQGADATFKYYFCLHANETLMRLEQTPKLVIAGLNGHTVGGGLEVAMAADLRIARQGAGKIGLPEVALEYCRALAARSGSRGSSAKREPSN